MLKLRLTLILLIFTCSNTLYSQTLPSERLRNKGIKKFEKIKKGTKGTHNYVGWTNAIKPDIPTIVGQKPISYLRNEDFLVQPQIDYYKGKDSVNTIVCSWVNRDFHGRIFQKLTFGENYKESLNLENKIWDAKYSELAKQLSQVYSKPYQAGDNFEKYNQENFEWTQKQTIWAANNCNTTLSLFIYMEPTEIDGKQFGLPTYGLWIVQEFK
jgi:hypothetical protein